MQNRFNYKKYKMQMQMQIQIPTQIKIQMRCSICNIALINIEAHLLLSLRPYLWTEISKPGPDGVSAQVSFACKH